MDAFNDDEESFVVLDNYQSTEFAHLRDATLNSLECANEAIEQLNDAAREDSKSINTSTCTLPSLPQTMHLDESAKDDDHSTSSSAEFSPDEIQRKVDFLMEENARLKSLNQQQTLEIKKQYEAVMVWRDDVLKVHELNKKKYDGTKNLIDNLKGENSELKSIQEALKEELGMLKKEKLRYELLKEEFSQKVEMVEEKENAEGDIRALTEQIEQLKMNEASLHRRIDEGLAINDQLRGQLLKKDERERELLRQNNGMQRQSAHDESEKEMRDMQEKLMAAQMHITELETARERDREILNEKEQIIAKLQDSIKEMSGKVELVELMKTQLKDYEDDFNAERDAKRQCIDDLNNLTSRNQELMEEVERYKAAVNATKLTLHDMPCPGCPLRFNNEQDLLNHLQRCSH